MNSSITTLAAVLLLAAIHRRSVFAGDRRDARTSKTASRAIGSSANPIRIDGKC